MVLTRPPSILPFLCFLYHCALVPKGTTPHLPFPSPQRQPHPLDLTAVLLQLQVLGTDCWSLGVGAAVGCGLPCSSCLASPGTPAPAPSCSPAQAPLLALELSHPQDSKTGEESEDEPPLLPPTNSFSNMGISLHTTL